MDTLLFADAVSETAASFDLGMAPYFAVAFYLVVLLALGVGGYRKSSPTEEDYYLAGRSQGWIVTSLTIIATFFSSMALLGVPGAVYKHGVVFMLFALNVPVAAAAVYVIGSRIRAVGQHFGHVTQADMIAGYYNGSVALRLLVALTGVLYAIPYIMMQLKAGGDLSAVLFAGAQVAGGELSAGAAFQGGAVVLATITMLYIMIGGMRSVAWTDVMQGVLLMGGMMLGGFALIASSGGFAEFSKTLTTIPVEARSAPGAMGQFPLSMIFTICLFGSVGSLVQPAQWMRYYSAASNRSLARSAMLFAIALPPCFLLGVMLVGLGARAAYPPEVIDGVFSVHSHIVSVDRVLIVSLKDQLPMLIGASAAAILSSLVMVAIMSASMSTADSNLHALSAVMVRDIYHRFIHKGSTSAVRVWVGRFVIIGTTLAALAIVLGSGTDPSKSTFDFMTMIATLALMAVGFSSQLLPVTFDILFFRKGSPSGAAAGLAAGLLGCALFGQMFTPLANWIASSGASGESIIAAFDSVKTTIGIHSSAWGLLFNVPVFMAVSWFTQPVEQSIKNDFANALSNRAAGQQ